MVNQPLKPPHVSSNEEIINQLNTNAQEGLTAQEASVRLKQYGTNELSAETTPKWRIFLRQFNNVIIYILLLAFGLTLLLQHYSDAVVIGLVVVINALIGYFQEVNAANALDRIKNLLVSVATVIRSGQRVDIPAAEVVPGDMVYLEAGDNVPADLRILDADNLRIQESALTGEADSVNKIDTALPADTPLAERQNMAYAATAVTNGSASGVVVATGQETELGQISASVANVGTQKTPLMRELDNLGKWISYFIIGVAILLFIFGWVRQLYALPTLALAIITMIVGSLPEGLPAATSVVLAMGVQKMTKQNAIVKTLPAVETLGAVDIIATDKTGTLTKNEMTVQDVVTEQNHYRVTGTGYAPVGEILLNDQRVTLKSQPQLAKLLTAGFEANDTELNETQEGWQINGEPTDGAFLTLFRKGFGHGASGLTELDMIPFDSEYRYIARLVADADDHRELMIKGSPDKLFPLAAKLTDSFDDNYWQNQVATLSAQGKRVVAVGYRDMPADQAELDHQDLQAGIHLLGVVGIIDPPREEVIAALKTMRRAGVQVKMITGDHPTTAAAIGQQLGLAEHIQTITGPELDKLSPDELAANITKYDVFARTTPQNKLTIINAYQANGLVTAMTGDGVNDAPALKKADIGVAMGLKGTDVAKDSADMVLADDNFTTLSSAIREGRRLYDNIRKTILFLLPTSFAEGLIVAISILLQQELPLFPAQLLWINMVSAITIQFAFIFEPAEPGIMNRPPRKTGRSLMNWHDVLQMTYVSLIIAAMGLIGFDQLTQNGVSTAVASTVAVNIIVLGKVFYLFNIRTRFLAFSKHFWSNPMAFVVIGLLMILQLGITYLPFMQSVFRTGPMTLGQWGIAAAAGLVVLIVAEADKLIRWRWQKVGQAKPFSKVPSNK